MDTRTRGGGLEMDRDSGEKKIRKKKKLEREDIYSGRDIGQTLKKIIKEEEKPKK